MAADSLTPAQAEELIGKTGRIKNPSKPDEWEGEYRITGYSLDDDDDSKVKTLKAESVEMLPPKEVRDPQNGSVTQTIPARPKYVAPHVPTRWFKPTEPAKLVTPIPSPTKPATPAAK